MTGVKIPDKLKPLVKFCYYIPGEHKHQQEVKEGHIFFDSMEALKLYCTTHTYAINMPSMINPKCKVCFGKGNTAFDVNTQQVIYCHKCLMKNLQEKIRELYKLAMYGSRNES